MGKSKRKGPNPYAERGLEKFSLVKTELTAKREEIAARLGVPMSEVRLTSKGTTGTWIAVYPSSVLHSSSCSSSSSSSPKSGSNSPRQTAFSFRPASSETGEIEEKVTHEEPPEKAVLYSFARNVGEKLGLSFILICTTGLVCGVLFATRSAHILIPIFMFFSIWFVLHLNRKAVSLWIRQMLELIFSFLRPMIDEKHGKVQHNHLLQKELYQNSSSARKHVSSLPHSSQSSQLTADSPSVSSLAGKGYVTPHSQKPSLPAIGESNNLSHKHATLPSTLMPVKVNQEEARNKIGSSGSRPRAPGGTVTASDKERSVEIRARPKTFSKTSRNAERQDITYGLLVMLIVILTGLAFGMAPGILYTSISWFFLPLMKEFAMSKDRTSISPSAVKTKEKSSKTSKSDQRIKYMQKR